MKLTKEQLDKLVGRLKKDDKCSNCKFSGDLTLHANEYQLTSVDRSGQTLSIGGSGRIVPLAMITCPECGFVKFFDLEVLGVTKT